MSQFNPNELLRSQGHIHAFWLIWRRNQAHKRYGPGGYHYAGSGRFAGGAPVVAPGGYGATKTGY
ncbi:hypothetical protein FRB95_005805 [Tulasnella sp. JGI-2019a]|nr:hypothetical protein FRB95_005805 [Tulasnella sp. JGI-2019a]